jgi:AcrR family transcriptional regulator
VTARPGLRERKRQRTYAALVEAASRLFREKGFEQTTIAEIVDAAEVSPRTFFSYFASKEDVFFAGADVRTGIGVDAIVQRGSGESLVDVVIRTVEEIIGSEATSIDLSSDVARSRIGQILSVPSLRAAAIDRLVAAGSGLARAWREAFPEELDEAAAGAVTGMVLGAMFGAGIVSLDRGDDDQQILAEVRRAVEFAVDGIRAGVPVMNTV